MLFEKLTVNVVESNLMVRWCDMVAMRRAGDNRCHWLTPFPSNGVESNLMVRWCDIVAMRRTGGVNLSLFDPEGGVVVYSTQS